MSIVDLAFVFAMIGFLLFFISMFLLFLNKALHQPHLQILRVQRWLTYGWIGCGVMFLALFLVAAVGQ